MPNDFKQNPIISLKPEQKVQFSLAMQQSLDVLQMPIEELAVWLQSHIEQNPLLEWDSSKKESSSLRERSIKKSFDVEYDAPYIPSLFEHLMNQARQMTNDSKVLEKLEWIIGNLDDSGFFTHSLEQAPKNWDHKEMLFLLSEVQKFDPPGIGAKDIQESLLLQLKASHKEGDLSFEIIQNHFEDLVLGKTSQIQKKCKVSEESLERAIRLEIAALDPFPGLRFQKKDNFSLIPDVYLVEQENSWKIRINEELLPCCFMKPLSFSEEGLSVEEQQCIRNYKMQGKWIFTSLEKRKETLYKITKCIVKGQIQFLRGESQTLFPLTVQDIAREAGLHESTVIRAISHKYLSCTLGIIPLKGLLSKSISKNSEHVSCDKALKLLQKLVLEEDKQEPLSDREILEKMRKIGVPCARRTVTKYRQQLHIPSRRFRKRCSY